MESTKCHGDPAIPWRFLCQNSTQQTIGLLLSTTTSHLVTVPSHDYNPEPLPRPRYQAPS